LFSYKKKRWEKNFSYFKNCSLNVGYSFKGPKLTNIKINLKKMKLISSIKISLKMRQKQIKEMFTHIYGYSKILLQPVLISVFFWFLQKRSKNYNYSKLINYVV
jgi:hypothetical protein